MSGHPTQQLQQELLNELTTSNQLLRLISIELQQIKELTNPGGELANNIKANASLVQNLGAMLQIDLENVPAIPRIPMNLSSQNESYQLRDTIQVTSNVNETN